MNGNEYNRGYEDGRACKPKSKKRTLEYDRGYREGEIILRLFFSFT